VSSNDVASVWTAETWLIITKVYFEIKAAIAFTVWKCDC